jgi:predicted nucleic acid-binding protein
MMILEDKRIFVDTNILIYANFSNAVLKEQARSKLLWFIQSNFEIWISRQVIREFLVYATRYNYEGKKIPIKEFLKPIFLNFEQYKISEDSIQTSENLRILIEKHDLSGKKIHDANIVATMQTYNISKLLTNNIKDFDQFNEIVEIISIIA